MSATTRSLLAFSSSTRGIHLSLQSFVSQGSRYFSEKKPGKHEWVVIIPDRKGTSELRQRLRKQHLTNLSTYPKGFWLWGGPFLHRPSYDVTYEPLGSMLLAWDESAEKVLEELKKDVYTIEGVWDWEKLQIYPFKSTLRHAM